MLTRTTLRSGTLILLMVVTAIGSALVARRIPPNSDHDTSVLAEPQPLGDLQLRNARSGGAFGTRELTDRWTLLYTGYLNCPDLCPTTLAMLSQLHHDLPATAQAQLQLAFASIDYQQDSAREVTNYTAQFSPGIVPLTGSAAELQALTRAVGFIDPPDERTGSASEPPRAVAHSSAIALINPRAKLHALFRYPQDPQQITRTLLRLLE